MKFKAEVKRVSQKKVSLDNIYSLVLETDNPNILDLGKLPADTVVTVEIGIESVND